MKQWQRALVTGASSGIGEEFTRQLASAGADLILVGRNSDKLEAIARELRAAVDVEVVVADLSRREDIGRAARVLTDTDPPVDLLINCAGLSIWGPFADHPIEEHEALVNVCAVAPMVLTHAALSSMKAAGRGTIVNVSSVCGNGPVRLLASYAAAKAFLNSLSQTVSAEMAASGVTITTVVPGPTRTPINEKAGQDTDTSGPEWMEPSRVVSAALRAAAAGKRHVIPGAANWLRTMVTPRYTAGPASIPMRAAGAAADRLIYYGYRVMPRRRR
ncbi:MAG TPA: SDR family NAD(P)-dependent oxidoreductase [Acidimicrobiales bacterium]|nr:SDR family NAD(P)-dependent oxidoreductase [Acidimicrobiales bacterium]